MSTYLIGDVQGCYRELQALLDLIQFNPDHDRLGFVGDLVNRGPQSLEVLRFIKSLKHPLVVLGNHDIFLVLAAFGLVKTSKDSTIDDVLNAPDKIELIEWLRHLPILIRDDFGVMVHAGVPPQWTMDQALVYANEVSAQFQSDTEFLKHIEGKKPVRWSDDLQGYDRARYIINAFTRMRFCSKEGRLDMKSKMLKSVDPTIYKPWYQWYQGNEPIFFGHWAAINGHTPVDNIYALDTGCVYGDRLTAIRVDDKELLSFKL